MLFKDMEYDEGIWIDDKVIFSLDQCDDVETTLHVYPVFFRYLSAAEMIDLCFFVSTALSGVAR